MMFEADPGEVLEDVNMIRDPNFDVYMLNRMEPWLFKIEVNS